MPNEALSEQQRSSHGGTENPGLNQNQAAARDPGGGTALLDRTETIDKMDLGQRLKSTVRQLSGITDQVDKMISSKGGAPSFDRYAGNVQDAAEGDVAITAELDFIDALGEGISTRLQWLETQN